FEPRGAEPAGPPPSSAAGGRGAGASYQRRPAGAEPAGSPSGGSRVGALFERRTGEPAGPPAGPPGVPPPSAAGGNAAGAPYQRRSPGADPVAEAWSGGTYQRPSVAGAPGAPPAVGPRGD